MALNMLDKRSLMNEMLPEVQISLNSTGIMVTSTRIAEPVIIPFDQTGKRPECKATELELDYMVTKEGCTIWCTRLKKQPRFVGFDCVYDLPGHTFIKIRNKARVFNVPHGFPESNCKPAVVSMPVPPQLPPIPEEKPMDFLLPPPPPEELAEEFMGSISAATTGIDFGTQTDMVSQVPPPPPQELAEEFMGSISTATSGMDLQESAQQSASQLEPTQEQEQKEWEGVQEFMDSIGAATTGLDSV